jgi:hypothetical protein
LDSNTQTQCSCGRRSVLPQTAGSLWSAQLNIILPKFHTYLSFPLRCAMGQTVQYINTASVLSWGYASDPGLAGLTVRERKLKSRSVKFMLQKSSLVTAGVISSSVARFRFRKQYLVLLFRFCSKMPSLSSTSFHFMIHTVTPKFDAI